MEGGQRAPPLQARTVWSSSTRGRRVATHVARDASLPAAARRPLMLAASPPLPLPLPPPAPPVLSSPSCTWAGREDVALLRRGGGSSAAAAVDALRRGACLGAGAASPFGREAACSTTHRPVQPPRHAAS
jgi:hypothetical protein